MVISVGSHEMEMIEIQSFALAPAVAASFAASWSDDDKISLITEKGLYIVEVIPDPENAQPGLEMQRSWVGPSDYFPTTETGIDCDSLIWKLKQQDVYSLIYDACLAPKLSSTKSIPPYITQVAWSPAGMLQYGRCFLATVTNYGCVQVQAPRSKRWLTVVDISSLWTKHCSQNWVSDADDDKDITVLRLRAEKLKATAITWSSIMCDGGKAFGLLVVGLLNGDIVVWRLNSITIRTVENLQPQMLLHFETNMHNVTALHWTTIDQHTGWLSVGDVRGVVKMFSLSMVKDKLQCISTTEVLPHCDRTEVTKLLTMTCDTTDNFSATILAIKGGYVVAVALDAEGNVMATVPHLVGRLSVTGVAVVAKQKLLVVTHNGSFKILDVVRTGAELKLESQVLNSIKLPKSAYYGIAISANKAICCLITSFCTLFDHLILRDPAQLIFFSICGLMDPYSLLLENPSQSLNGFWDCLELIRLQGPPFRELEAMGLSDQLDELTTYQLKVHFWLCKFSVVQGDQEDLEKQTALEVESRRALRLVLNRHVCKLASELMKHSSLTSEDEESLALLLSWLRKADAEMSAEGPTQAAMRDVLRRASKYKHLPEFERCRICDEKCDKIENPSEMRCLSGHSLPRCCRSLRQCADIPLWTCRVCHSIAHTNSGLIEAPVCVYCDTLLYLDDRLVLPG